MPNLSDYGKMLRDKRCYCNGRPSLAGLPVDHEEHVGGWKVEGFEFRQWLSVTCLKCKYSHSFTNFKIPGKATFEEQLEEEIRRYGHVMTSTQKHSSQELEAQLVLNKGIPIPASYPAKTCIDPHFFVKGWQAQFTYRELMRLLAHVANCQACGIKATVADVFASIEAGESFELSDSARKIVEELKAEQ